MLDTQTINCPYCAEPIELMVDVSAGSQRYVEDCQVCCRPIEISLDVSSDGDFAVHAASADDA